MDLAAEPAGHSPSPTGSDANSKNPRSPGMSREVRVAIEQDLHQIGFYTDTSLQFIRSSADERQNMQSTQAIKIAMLESGPLQGFCTSGFYRPSEGWTDALLTSRQRICSFDLMALILGPDVASPAATYAGTTSKGKTIRVCCRFEPASSVDIDGHRFPLSPCQAGLHAFTATGPADSPKPPWTYTHALNSALVKRWRSYVQKDVAQLQAATGLRKPVTSMHDLVPLMDHPTSQSAKPLPAVLATLQ